MFFSFRRLLQIEAESKRTHTIPSHILSPDYKDAIMRQEIRRHYKTGEHTRILIFVIRCLIIRSPSLLLSLLPPSFSPSFLPPSLPLSFSPSFLLPLPLSSSLSLPPSLPPSSHSLSVVMGVGSSCSCHCSIS